jgi:DNA-binding MarR family transcriptional regulator
MLTCTKLIENEVRVRLKAEFGETLAQFDLMSQLYRQPDGIRMGELSQRLMVTSGNVTGLVDRLIRKKFVERKPSGTDRRILFVTLTPLGHEAFSAMAAAHERWVTELLKPLNMKSVSQFMQLLADTKKAVRKIAAQMPVQNGRVKRGAE